MKKNTPIVLDRLERALAAQGVTLKRHQLLDVAAAAFGHRSPNEMSAADAAGDLSAPAAIEVGRDQYGLAVLHDPVAGRRFAVDMDREAVRADRWTVSPYGHLLDVSAIERMNEGADRSLGVHLACIQHEYGTNFYAATDEAGLWSQVAGFCRESWDEEARGTDLPSSPSGLSDEQTVRTYFAHVERETLEITGEPVAMPTARLGILESATGEAWVIRRTDLEDDEFVLWWNEVDGWGDLASATVFAQPSGRLPVLGMEEGSVAWDRLPGGAVKHVKDPTASSATIASAYPLLWTEDELGEQEQLVRDVVLARGISPIPGVDFRHLTIQRLQDEADAGVARRRLVIHAEGVEHLGHDVLAWQHAVSEVLQRAGVEVVQHDGGITAIMTGDGGISEAGGVDDWLAATTDLLTPVGSRERIIADFTPEAWIRNYATEVDKEGDEELDVTYEMLLIGRDNALQLDSGDSDHLLEALRSPRWIRDWSGPFTIRVNEAVEESCLWDEDGRPLI